jgi:UDP:flavonoid glycosyltransferase YjiC (YdhE family)
MAAGVPQLVQPMSHDQPDNAMRLKRLGIGDSLSVKKFRGPAVAEKLRALIESHNVARNCRDAAARFVGVRPLDDTCDLIESLLPA